MTGAEIVELVQTVMIGLCVMFLFLIMAKL